MYTETGRIMPKYEHYLIDDVKKSSARQLFTVISTFAGGGGSSTGYRLAGGKVIAINEFVEEAIKTYSTNFPDTIVIPGDIKKISGKDFLDAGHLEVGELDILDGSPPCSAFSVAGKREKNWKGAVKDTTESHFDFETGEVVSEGEVEVRDGVKQYSDDQLLILSILPYLNNIQSVTDMEICHLNNSDIIIKNKSELFDYIKKINVEKCKTCNFCNEKFIKIEDLKKHLIINCFTIPTLKISLFPWLFADLILKKIIR
jgi:hypothetical protein